jgi:hypothetical protein
MRRIKHHSTEWSLRPEISLFAAIDELRQLQQPGLPVEYKIPSPPSPFHHLGDADD